MVSSDARTPTVPMFIDDAERYRDIRGNVSDEVKRALSSVISTEMLKGRGFADGIGGRLCIVEANVIPKTDEPERLEGRVISELDITEGTL